MTLSISLELLTEETIYIAEEMINSNPRYNEMEHQKAIRSREEIQEEFLTDKTESYLIKLDDTYIGMLEYMRENPKDGYFWLGFLLIHGDYQGYSFGTQAYLHLEEKVREMGEDAIRLAVLVENENGKRFWERLGFTYYDKTVSNHDNEVYCLEKQLL